MITDEQKQQLSPMPYWDDYLCFPQPCWHNIYPGKTTTAEALEIIQADTQLHIDSNIGKFFTCVRVGNSRGGAYIQSSYARRDLVYNIIVSERYEHELRMKDVVTIYGTPLTLHYTFSEGVGADGVYVYFSGNVIARVSLNNPKPRLVYPDSSIVQMYYESRFIDISDDQPWVGYSDVEAD